MLKSKIAMVLGLLLLAGAAPITAQSRPFSQQVKQLTVINRTGAEDQMISRAKAEEFMDMQIFWQVSNDSKSMMGARNEGKPLIQFAPKSKPCQDLLELARLLTVGASVETPVEPKKKTAFSFFGTRK